MVFKNHLDRPKVQQYIKKCVINKKLKVNLLKNATSRYFKSTQTLTSLCSTSLNSLTINIFDFLLQFNKKSLKPSSLKRYHRNFYQDLRLSLSTL